MVVAPLTLNLNLHFLWSPDRLSVYRDLRSIPQLAMMIPIRSNQSPAFLSAMPVTSNRYPSFSSSFSIRRPRFPIHVASPLCYTTKTTVPARRTPSMARAVVPSKKLLAFVEDKAQIRVSVVKSVAAYIKEHNLQDPKDKRIVYCDDKLRALLGVEQCTFLEISKYLSPHLRYAAEVGGRYADEGKEVEREYNKARAKARIVENEVPEAKSPPRKLRAVVPIGALLQIVKDKAQLRGTIIKALSDYAKEHNLQDTTDKSLINCDAILKDIFGVDKCTFLEINKYVSASVRKPEDMGGRYVKEAQAVEKADLDAKLRKQELSENKAEEKVLKRKAGIKARGNMNPVVLSPDLAAICRAKELPRTEIIKAVWAYVHMNNLQTGPGAPVKCDYLMEKVFKADSVNPRAIMKGISPHFKRKE